MARANTRGIHPITGESTIAIGIPMNTRGLDQQLESGSDLELMVAGGVLVANHRASPRPVRDESR